jgi:hypothetical protein
MSAPDRQYVGARRVLLDALGAADPYLASLVLVGAQAVYLRTERARLTVAPFTIDGDIAVDPAAFPGAPPLETALSQAGFVLGEQPGSWSRVITIDGREMKVDVDFMVPAAVAPGPGTRSVELEGHSRRATRRVRGLEAALVDHGPMEIGAFEVTDMRRVKIEVAHAGALVIAKVHKIAERGATARGARTQVDKDAGDIYRLMQVTLVPEMAASFRTALAVEMSREVTESALDHLDRLFGRPGLPGVEMAIRAIGVGGEAPDTIRATLTAYVASLRSSL